MIVAPNLLIELTIGGIVVLVHVVETEREESKTIGTSDGELA